MSKEYRVEVSLNGRAWCCIDVHVGWAAEVLDDIRVLFPEENGYRLRIFVAEAERRIIESGPEGVRLLSRNPLFKLLKNGDST